MLRRSISIRSFSTKLDSLVQQVAQGTIPVKVSPITDTTPIVRENDTSSRVDRLVQELSDLTLLEASLLVKQLKVKLNIQDVVSMTPAKMESMESPSASPPSNPSPTASTPETQVKTPSTFKLSVTTFDPPNKAKLIREIKALLPSLNLVEAKKFVESLPKVVMEAVPAQEVEKVKKQLEAAGATVTLE